MERDESVLLHEPDLMLTVVRVAAASAGTLDACVEHLRALRERAEVEHRVPEAYVRAQLKAITARLDRARLIEWPKASRFRITARGREVLADHPSGVDDGVLVGSRRRAPPMARRTKRRGSERRPAPTIRVIRHSAPAWASPTIHTPPIPATISTGRTAGRRRATRRPR
jgi:hypothetical protein